jgi:hypothetical protein
MFWQLVLCNYVHLCLSYKSKQVFCNPSSARYRELRAPARYYRLGAPPRQLTSSSARNLYAATLSTCSYLLGHDMFEATASPHDEGQLIIRIRTKCWFLTLTKEKDSPLHHPFWSQVRSTRILINQLCKYKNEF